MSLTRKTDKNARIIDQCARGRYVRNIVTKDFIFAAGKSGNSAIISENADVVSSGNIKRGMFIVPCDAIIEGISVVGTPYPMHPVSGNLTYIQFYKARADTTDVPMLSDNAGLGLQLGGVLFTAATSGNVSPTWVSTNVVTDGTIYESGQTSLLAGDAIYTIVSSFAIYVSSVANVTTMVEWIPNDKSYASS